MKDFTLTQAQIKTILKEIAKEEEGFYKLLKLSLESLMEAEREEYKQEVKDSSNGYRKRRILGLGNSQLILDVPRTRKTNFYPVLLAILNDREEEAKELAFKLYSSGLTTEQVGDIFETLYGQHYSKSQVSRIFSRAKEEVYSWLERPLESYYPIVYIDAVFIPTRHGDSVIQEAYYTVLGVSADRSRDVLAIIDYPTENMEGWKDVLKSLKERGVKRIDLFVSDALPGIENAIAANFSSADIQFCTVHLKRNVLSKIKPSDKDKITKELKDVFITDDKYDSIEKGWQRWKKFIEQNMDKYPHLKSMLSLRFLFYFTYLKYDYRIRTMIYSTNWIERLNRDYRRVTRMRGAMPSAQATLALLGAVAMDKKSFNRKLPKLNLDNKFDWID